MGTIRALRKLGVLSDEDFVLLNELRGLRNQAVHSTDFNPSKEAVSDYLDLTGAIQARLEDYAAGVG
jgi:hypothetical protein